MGLTVVRIQDPSDSQNAQSGGQMGAEGSGQQLEASMEEVMAGQEGKDRWASRLRRGFLCNGMM